MHVLVAIVESVEIDTDALLAAVISLKGDLEVLVKVVPKVLGLALSVVGLDVDLEAMLGLLDEVKEILELVKHALEVVTDSVPAGEFPLLIAKPQNCH